MSRNFLGPKRLVFMAALMIVAAAVTFAATASSPSSQPTRPAVPSAEEVLKQVLQERPTATPLLPVEPGMPVRGRVWSPSDRTSSGQSGQLLPDGYILVDRTGRLVRDGMWWTLVLEGTGQSGSPEQPIRLLPNRMLQTMEVASAGGTRSLLFEVSGEVTEYRGTNYLLVRHVMIKRAAGNLSK